MKEAIFVRTVSLGILISVLATPAFALGKKRQAEDVRSASARLILVIEKDQDKIVFLNNALDIGNKIVVENLPALDKLTVTELVDLEVKKNAELKELDERIVAQFSHRYDRFGYKPNFDTAHVQPSRCASLKDQLNNYLPVVKGRKAWAMKCLKRHGDELELKNVKNYAEKGYHDPVIEDQINLFRMSAALVDLEGGLDAATTGDTGRYFYPAFGKLEGTQPVNPGCKKDNPKCLAQGKMKAPEDAALLAPINEDTPCDVSEVLNPGQSTEGDPSGTESQTSQVPVDLFNDVDYQLVALCVSGCYTPDQAVLFPGGYKEIGQAFKDGDREVTTLTSDSSIDHLNFQTSEIEAYTVDIAPSLQEVLDFETASGKKITVTRNHPLLDSEGRMREAESFLVGQSLVQTDGRPDLIVRISGRNYFGKVYNIGLKTADLAENIVSAQGFLSGSVFYQNEGTKYLNRALFRLNLPRALTE